MKVKIQIPSINIWESEIRELIRRRRRQIAVHSIIYYKLDTNIISDTTFDKWCHELIELQRKYPKVAQSVELNQYFENLTHASGFNLQCLDDPSLVNTAKRLIKSKKG